MTWDEDCDFISIGSGIGGLVGALTAHARGLSSIVLEKADKIGGVTAYGAGLLWVAGSRPEALAGITDSTEAGYRYIWANSIGFADGRLLRRLVESAPLAVDFLADEAGVPWAVVPDASDWFWPSDENSRAEGRILKVEPFPIDRLGTWGSRLLSSPHMPRNPAGIGDDVLLHGPALVAYLVKAAMERSVPIRTRTRVTGLIVADGRVVGIRADRDGSPVRVRARKGVLVAVGGYDWNPQLARFHDHAPARSHSASPPSVTGDHLVFAGKIGAATAKVPPMPRLGYHLPGETNQGEPLWRLANLELGHPHAILVNREGRRFADESFHVAVGSTLLKIDLANLRMPNYPCWMVTDQQWWDKFSLGPLRPGGSVPPGAAVRAESLEALADLVGIDRGGLVSEVARFNAFVSAGRDADFHRGERPWSLHASRRTLRQRGVASDDAVESLAGSNLGSVDIPPFYAVPMEVTASSISSTGLVADEHARVLDLTGQPIDGLYVAGNSMAPLDLGAAHLGGIANTRGMTFAYLAALDATSAIVTDPRSPLSPTG